MIINWSMAAKGERRRAQGKKALGVPVDKGRPSD